MPKDRPWSWVVALDGGGLDGRRGAAGLLRFDWPSKKIKFRFYDGISGGHNPSVSPSGKKIILGNFSQTILVVDADTLEPIARQSMLAIEETDDRLHSNTHHLWYDDRYFIGAVGKNLYKFDLENLSEPEKLGAHGMVVPHELRWSSDHRYILMGDIGPKYEKINQVGIFDLQTRKTKILATPGTVWHVAAHPQKSLGYGITYTYTVSNNRNYANRNLVPELQREYILSIDLADRKILDSWSCSADFPIHLVSDFALWADGEEEKLYAASGGSHTVVEVNARDFSAPPRVIRIIPNWWHCFWSWRQRWRNIFESFSFGSIFNSSHLFIKALLVSGWRVFDGVYSTRVSPDGKYLIAGNRGYNCLWVIDRKTFRPVYKKMLPVGPDGLHLGLHHSEIISL